MRFPDNRASRLPSSHLPWSASVLKSYPAMETLRRRPAVGSPEAGRGLAIETLSSLIREHSLTVTLIALTFLACLIRALASPSGQGTMGRDESRLAMAARAILD